MKKLIEQLERIAKANADKFVYRIHLSLWKRAVRYIFEAEETSDNHTFVMFIIPNGDVENFTPDQATIKEACEDWYYTYVE